MTDSNRMLVLSGPSGSGKSTIVNRVIAESPVKMMKMVSATTRPPREGEVDGEAYWFLSDEGFARRREANEFIEYEEVFSQGYWYGTLKSELARAAENSAWAFLEIDVQGALRVMDQYPQIISIFLTTPSEEVFEQRLRDRGTESEEVIQSRLQRARTELESAHRYRHQVCNDTLDRAVAEIIEIIVSKEAELNA